MNQLQPYYKFHLAVYFFDNLTQCCLFSFIHRNNLHCTTSWHLSQTKNFFVAKIIKFRSFLKIGRVVMGEKTCKKFFASPENRNSNLQNFSLWSKFFISLVSVTMFSHLFEVHTWGRLSLKWIVRVWEAFTR